MNNKVAYAEVEQDDNNENIFPFCPVCGKATMELDEEENGKVTGCKHLEFIYVQEVNEFEYKSDQFKDRFNIIDFDEFELDNLKTTLETIGYTNSLLALEVTTNSIACGPSAFTSVFGFNYTN